MILGELNITGAAATAMLPITVFASWIGLQYWFAGTANATFALAMLAPGLLAGGGGIWIGRTCLRQSASALSPSSYWHLPRT